jgi:nitrite reductase/ring-hydroxylating ferredoxin subunit
MPDHQLTRRGVLAGSAVAVVGAVTGWIAARHDRPRPSAGRATTPSNPATPLAHLADIPSGGGLVLSGQPFVLTRAGDQVRGFSSTCTHQGCTVSDVKDGRISCPCHGSQFDATTGAVVTGPATTPLAQVPVVVRNGEVFPA